MSSFSRFEAVIRALATTLPRDFDAITLVHALAHQLPLSYTLGYTFWGSSAPELAYTWYCRGRSHSVVTLAGIRPKGSLLTHTLVFMINAIRTR